MGDRERATAPSGVLVVDKPVGPTSHDVVSRVRRALGTRRVGHAGTLDPMASGVLVVLVGEGTKLEPYLSCSDKAYDAAIALGRETDTLDRLGETVEERVIDEELRGELVALAAACAQRGAPLSIEDVAEVGATRVSSALSAERRRTEQVPPRFSAIKVGGRKGYDRARSGEDFDLEARPVRLLDVVVTGASADPAALDLRLVVSKGYYVRSLARDVGEALGTKAHLSALRRTRSGSFSLDGAVELEGPPTRLSAALVAVVDAARLALSAETLTPRGVFRAERGQPLQADDFASGLLRAGAWLDPEGLLVAIGSVGDEGVGRVQRGFARPGAAASTGRSSPDET